LNSFAVQLLLTCMKFAFIAHSVARPHLLTCKHYSMFHTHALQCMPVKLFIMAAGHQLAQNSPQT
jgi:hypothetical protein